LVKQDKILVHIILCLFQC